MSYEHSKPITTTEVRGVHHDNLLIRLNARVGLCVTLAVGTMWCAYLFAAAALFALPQAIHGGLYYIIVWLSSSFLQLVLLPVIIVGQNIQGRAADARAEMTYQDTEAILGELHQLQEHLKTQDDVIAQLRQQLTLE